MTKYLNAVNRLRHAASLRQLATLSSSSTSNVTTNIKTPPNGVPIIFNREMKRIQRDRAALNAENSRKVDYLKDEVANRIVDRMLDIKRSFKRVLDLGSGCGHLAKAMDDDILESMVQLELSGKMLRRDPTSSYSVQVDRVHGDEELLPFEENEFDAVLSNLSLHWVNDLPGALIQARRVLKPDGVFLGAMFGGDTLYELRTALQLAEIEREGGISPHVSPMTDVRDVGALLSRAGLTLTTVDIDEIVVNYPSMFELMDDLKAMGEGNAVISRKPFLSKDTFMAASAAYQAIYGEDDGSIPATFQIIYMIGWKPDASQPQPLERGSATKSLKDAL